MDVTGLGGLSYNERLDGLFGFSGVQEAAG